MKLLLRAQISDIEEPDGSRFIRINLEGHEGPGFEVVISPTGKYFKTEIHLSTTPDLPPFLLEVPDRQDLASIQKLYEEIQGVVLQEYNPLIEQARRERNGKGYTNLTTDLRKMKQDLLRDLLSAFAPSPKSKWRG